MSPVLCRFSAAGNTVYQRAHLAGGRKAPRHEIAVWGMRWGRAYGDFATGSGFAVMDRRGHADAFGVRPEADWRDERTTERLSGTVIGLRGSEIVNFGTTRYGPSLSAESQRRQVAALWMLSIRPDLMMCRF